MYPPIKYDDNIRNLIVRFKKQQEELRKKIVLKKPEGGIKIIAGCDSALIDDKIFSIFVMFNYPSLEEIEMQSEFSKLEFPYIPGYLSFRELPNLVKAYEK